MVLKTLAIVGTVAALAAVVLVVFRLADDLRIQALWGALAASGDGEVFSPDMVAGLPEPARRYLLHAIQPGTPLAASAELDMVGTIRLKPADEWLAIRGTEVLAVPHGLIWKASVGHGVLRVTGYDRYGNGQGRMAWRLWGLIPIVRAAGPDIGRSARGRLFIEAIWLPSALLPHNGVQWESLDNDTARATAHISGERMELVIGVASDGTLRTMSIRRWGNQTRDGSYADIPFGGKVMEEGRFGGYTVPSRLAVGWWVDSSGYFEFFRPEITGIRYR